MTGKIYLRVNRQFVKTDLESRNGGTYNKVTLPKNMEIGGRSVGGFCFYPKYVNEDIYNPKLVNIPLLADRMIQLHSKEDMLEVSPEALEFGFRESYNQWKTDKGLAIGDAARTPAFHDKEADYEMDL